MAQFRVTDLLSAMASNASELVCVWSALELMLVSSLELAKVPLSKTKVSTITYDLIFMEYSFDSTCNLEYLKLY